MIKSKPKNSGNKIIGRLRDNVHARIAKAAQRENQTMSDFLEVLIGNWELSRDKTK